jgi:hypothetical protein
MHIGSSGADGADGTGSHPASHPGLWTTCGREIRVGHLVLGGSHRPARRVSLSISASSPAGEATWTGLTPAEARRLADILCRQAAACEAAGAMAGIRSPKAAPPRYDG